LAAPKENGGEIVDTSVLVAGVAGLATTGYVCCSQIGAGFPGIPNYANVAANWPLAMLGNGALMSLLQSDSNQVAGRFLDQQVRWRRYLVVFVGPRLRRSAPPTIPCPQTIHGLLMGQAAEDDRVHVDGGGDNRGVHSKGQG